MENDPLSKTLHPKLSKALVANLAVSIAAMALLAIPWGFQGFVAGALIAVITLLTLLAVFQAIQINLMLPKQKQEDHPITRPTSTSQGGGHRVV